MIPTISTQVTFNVGSILPQVTFSDVTNYSSFGISLSQVSGIIRMNGPSGIFHNGSFTSPDLILNVNNSFQKNLPLDAAGNFLQGAYSFLYRNQVTWVDNIVSSTGFDFAVFGDRVDSYLPGQQFVATGPNAGTYNVSSVSYDSVFNRTNINVFQTLPSPGVVGGAITVINEYSQTLNYNLCYERPVVNIEVESDCDCANLESSDLTNYTIQVNGVSVYPSNISRVHTVKSPIQANGQPVEPDFVTNLANAVVTGIWTGTYVTLLEVVATYLMPDGLVVVDNISGTESHTVECNEGLCCVYQCLENIFNQYKLYVETNASIAERYKVLITKVLSSWMLYSIARSCAQNSAAAKYLNEIIDYAKASNCNCCNDTDTDPVKVVPICGGVAVSGSGGNVIVTAGNGIIVSSNTVGSTTTYQVSVDASIIQGIIAVYLAANPQTLVGLADVNVPSPVSGNVLWYDGVDWIGADIPLNSIANFSVTNPQIGSVLTWNGSNFVAQATVGLLLATNDVTYGIATPGEQSFVTETLNADNLQVDGSYLEIQALYFCTSSTNPKKVGVKINSTKIFESISLNSLSDRVVKINLKMIRVTPTSVNVTTEIRIGNIANQMFSNYDLVAVQNYNTGINNFDTTPNIIDFYANPGVGDVINLSTYFIDKHNP